MKRNNRIATSLPILIFISVVLIGCATTLSNKAALVRVTSQREDIKACKYLGQVTSSSSWGGFAATGIGFESAMNELKNKAAELGANVLLTQVVSNTMGGSQMIGDAYYCQDHTKQK